MLDRKQLKNIIWELRNISAGFNDLYLTEINKLEEILDNNKYKVGVIGEFSSGKSTFLNAIVGKRILYSSNDEATGVITLLESDTKKLASIFMEDGSIKELELESSDSYEKLRSYVDIKNTKNKVTSVGINYPLKGIDKEICFIDTPGLQGISPKQMEVTKEILKEANATIMLITKKGISQTELDILTGNNKSFGRINTKEIFIVINKIGEIYAGKTEVESIEKIKEIKNKVIEELKKNGIVDVKVFTVDSKDYLWSCDDELYKEYVDENDPELNTILNQGQYRHRSDFETFKEFLLTFLEEGQRNKNFIEDVTNKIEYIIEAFIDKFSDNESAEVIKDNQLMTQLHNQKDILIKNRRKLYNSVTRYISNSFDEFSNRVEGDINLLKKERNKQMAVIISEMIKSKNEVNKEQVDLCYKKVKEIIYKDVNEFEAKLNQHQNIMVKLLINKRFSEDFTKLINRKAALNLQFELKDVKIDVDFKKIEYQENKMISVVKKDIEEVENKIKTLNSNIVSIKAQLPELKLCRMEEEKKKAKNKFESDKREVGSRPSPEQKYREVERTKRKFLFFKETYYDTVPDGLDYSVCEAWDKRIKNITDNYLSSIEKIEVDIEKNGNMLILLRRKEKEIEKLHIKKIQLKVELNDINRQLEIRKLKNEKQFIEDKKAEIYKQFERLLKSQYDLLIEKINEIIFNNNNLIKQKVKMSIEGYIEAFSVKLDREIQALSVELKIGDEESENIKNKLSEMKGRIQ